MSSEEKVTRFIRQGSKCRSTVNRVAFLELYHAGDTDPNIAAKLQVSRPAVTRMRMKLGLRANQQKHFSRQLFHELHANGLTDGQIAKILGVSRSTILRYRQKNELAPSGKKNDRGLGKVSPDKTYYSEVRRVMRHPTVCRYIYNAARRFRQEVLPTISDLKTRKKYEKVSWIATVVHPRPRPQFVPGPFCSVADNLDRDGVRYIVSIEQQVEWSNIAGVPGPKIFELAESVKTGSPEYLDELAMAAVKQAFLVGVDELVSYVMEQKWDNHTVQLHQRSYVEYVKRWREIENHCVEQAPCQTPRRKRLSLRPSIPRSTPMARGSGRVGVGGGMQNINNSIAWAAAQGY